MKKFYNLKARTDRSDKSADPDQTAPNGAAQI